MALSRVNGTVVGVTVLIVTLYWVSAFLTLLPWLEFSVPGVTHTSLLTCTTSAALFCFFACVFTDPGRVDDEWGAHLEEGRVVVEVKKTSGRQRYCQKCQRPKPPRTHHCKICKRCVLRMDHHCPWMNNCIGAKNYRVFMLFLMYITAAAVHCLGILGTAMVFRLQQYGLLSTKALDTMKKHNKGVHLKLLQWSSSQITMQVLCLVLLVPLTIGLMLLLVWNMYLMVTNRTTIEYHEGVTAKIRAARHGATYQHPYDLGLFRNLSAICGAHAFHWLNPFPFGIQGDGMQFPTRWDDYHPQLVSVEPGTPLSRPNTATNGSHASLHSIGGHQ